MTNLSKKINVDLNFIVEQVTPVTFVCSNLPDRKIFIEKKGTNYYYTTTFNESLFTFSYSTETIRYSNRPAFTVMEKIHHDLSSFFYNYVDESYAINTFKDVPLHKAVEVGSSKYDRLFYFFVSVKFSQGNFYNVYENRYVYDNEKDNLLKASYKTPDKLSNLFKYACFSTACFSFHESINNESIVFDVSYSPYMQNFRVILSEEELIIYNLLDKSKSSFIGNDVVLSELDNLMFRMIVEAPSKPFLSLVSSLKYDLKKITMDEIRLISMVDY